MEEESIMSGDSPSSHRRDEPFDFGRSSPPPTTSKDTAVQAGNPALPPPAPGNPAIVYASVAIDPNKSDKEKDEENKDDLCSPILNTSEEDAGVDHDRTVRIDECGYSGKDRDKKDEKKKLNGDFDKLDGVYSLSRDRKQAVKQEEQDDDNCVVKCLYVTLQCCECSIM